LDKVGRLDGLKKGWTMSQGNEGSLRGLMPQVAEWIDDLRQVFGREVIDAIVLNGKRGHGTFWARETGPDGKTREFGSRPQQHGGHDA
jgi:hypothetical protein